MSKFVRIAQQSGIQPTDLMSSISTQLPQAVPQNPLPQAPQQQAPQPVRQQTVQAPVNSYNVFAKAGINSNAYIGTAEQNEKLRRVLDPSNQSKTFYEAYVKAYGRWDAHPNARIENLNGNNALRAENAAKQKATNEKQWSQNPLNSQNANSMLNPQYNFYPKPNYQNLYSPQDPFSAMQKNR